MMGPWFGWGLGGWGAWVSVIFMIVFWGLVIWGIVAIIRWSTRSSAHNSCCGNSESALDILKKRYARGEINKDEFEEKKKILS